MSPQISERMKSLQSEIFDLYNNVASSQSEHPKIRSYAKATDEHTRRVIGNIIIACRLMGCPLSDVLYASAACHDIGRMKKKPADFQGDDNAWRTYRDNNHHTVSAEDCVEPLARNNFTEYEIGRISSLVEYHGIDIEKDADIEVRMLQIADKLDRLGVDGAKRLYDNRRNRGLSHDDSKSDAAATMKEAYQYLYNLGLSSRLSIYVKQKYEEGKEYSKI